MTLGEKLKLLRMKENMSQKELSTRLDVKNTVISNWENNLNKPNVDYIAALCGIFNVSPNFFFEVETENKESGPIFTAEEYEIIKKYRQLDQRGQQAVLGTLNRELSYLENTAEQISSIAADAIDTIDKITGVTENRHGSVRKK